jgi:hypothetical protein
MSREARDIHSRDREGAARARRPLARARGSEGVAEAEAAHS